MTLGSYGRALLRNLADFCRFLPNNESHLPIVRPALATHRPIGREPFNFAGLSLSLVPEPQISVAMATNCPSSRSGYRGPGSSYQRLGATRYLEGSASVSTRFAKRSRSGIGQGPIAYRDLSLPAQCVERLGRREHTLALAHHRKLDWPSAGTPRTARSANPATELVSALLRGALWALPIATFLARTANAPTPRATA